MKSLAPLIAVLSSYSIPIFCLFDFCLLLNGMGTHFHFYRPYRNVTFLCLLLYICETGNPRAYQNKTRLLSDWQPENISLRLCHLHMIWEGKGGGNISRRPQIPSEAHIASNNIGLQGTHITGGAYRSYVGIIYLSLQGSHSGLGLEDL